MMSMVLVALGELRLMEPWVPPPDNVSVRDDYDSCVTVIEVERQGTTRRALLP